MEKFHYVPYLFCSLSYSDTLPRPEDCPQEKKKSLKSNGGRGGWVRTNWIEKAAFSQFVRIFKNLGL